MSETDLLAARAGAVLNGWEPDLEGEGLAAADRVWEALEQLNRQSVSSSQRAPWIAEELRCALLQSTAQAMAGRVPVDLYGPIVQQGLWTAETALTQVAGLFDERVRAAGLVVVVGALSPPDRFAAAHRALELVSGIEAPAPLAEALRGLTPHLPEAYLDQVLALIRGLEPSLRRGECFHQVAVRLPIAEQRTALLTEALQSVQAEEKLTADAMYLLVELAAEAPGVSQPQFVEATLESLLAFTEQADIQSAWVARLAPYMLQSRRLEVMEELLERAVQFYPFGCAQVLARLSEHLPEVLVSKAIAAARSMPRGADRLRALVGMLPRMGAADREQVVAELLSAIHSIDPPALPWLMDSIGRWAGPTQLARALEATRQLQAAKRPLATSKLVPWLPRAQARKVAEQILEQIDSVTDEFDRGYVLAAVAPTLAVDRSAELLAVLELVRTHLRYETLEAIAPHLGPDRIGQALELAGMEKRALEVVAPHLTPPVVREALRRLLEIPPHVVHRQQALATLLQHVAPAVLMQALGLSEAADRALKLGRGIPSLLQETLDVRLTIGDETHLVQALITLGELCSAEEQQDVWTSAIDVACRIGQYGSPVTMLMRLAQRARGAVRSRAAALAREKLKEQHQDLWPSILSERVPLLDELLPEALAIRQAVNDRCEHATVLSAKLNESERRAAISSASRLRNPFEKAQTLSRLLPHLGDQERDRVERKALEALFRIEDTTELLRVLEELVRFSGLSPRAVRQVVRFVSNIADPAQRAHALLLCGSALPSEQPIAASLLQEALAATMAIEDQRQQATILSRLTPELPTGLLERAAAVASDIADPTLRSQALAQVAERAEPASRPALADQALTAARAIRTPRDRIRAICVASVFLSPEARAAALREALQAARQLGTSPEMAQAVADVVVHLEGLGPALQYEVVHLALRILASCARPDALGTLSHLLPRVVDLGGEQVGRKLAQVLLEIGSRWP